MCYQGCPGSLKGLLSEARLIHVLIAQCAVQELGVLRHVDTITSGFSVHSF